MNIQRFVLPAAIAAAFHAVLLYGFGQPTKIVTKTGPTPIDRGCTLVTPVELVEQPIEKDDEVPAVKSMPQGSSRPENEEQYTEMRETPFVIAPLKSYSKQFVDTGKIEPPGVPNGGPDVGTINFKPVVTWAMLDQPPRAKVQIPPDYPSSMKNDGRNGTVMVEFDVDMKGRVVGARVRESTDRAFEEPTLRAVLKWRFEPGMIKGRAVPFRMVIPVKFNLGAD